jgi:N,N'-diacetyllegionaminate synthase
MNAMLTLKKEFHYPVGYSDHTKGIMIPVMAVAMGAEIIEKHFTLDKTMEGPDHVASLDVPELREMVQAIRNVELARGDGEKKPTPKELSTRIVVRKSIVSVRDMKKGEIIQKEDLTVKRPAHGLPPKYLYGIIGKRLTCDIPADTVMLEEYFS